MDNFGVGYQVFTASGVVKEAGKPVAVYSIYVNSDGVGGGLGRLYSGAAVDSTKILFSFAESGANANSVHPLAGGNGVVFPEGCYVEIPANVDYATVAYQLIRP